MTAIMLGALTLQGLQPGPLLFQQHSDMVFTLFIGMIFCYICMLISPVVFAGDLQSAESAQCDSDARHLGSLHCRHLCSQQLAV